MFIEEGGRMGSFGRRGGARRRAWGRSALAAGTGVLLVAAAACSSDGASSGEGTPGPTATGTGGLDKNVTLTVYSGQHESFTQALLDGFTADTGIKVDLRSGKDAELANQIIEEGSGSKADVFMSEEPGPIAMLDKRGLLAHVDQSTLDSVEKRVEPSSGNWVPYAARVRVIIYNPKEISEDQLPNSIMDLADPQWKGKFAYAPSGAFVSTVSYLINTIGADDTLAWLKGIKANGVNEGSNGKVRDTVEAGQHAFGLINHYYWWILASQKGGPDKLASKLYHFDHPDAGGLILASGAGILKSSKHQPEAQALLAWLTSKDGGQKIVSGEVGDTTAPQYPVAPGVTNKVGLEPLADLKAPDVDQGAFADTQQAQQLILQAGIA